MMKDKALHTFRTTPDDQFTESPLTASEQNPPKRPLYPQRPFRPGLELEPVA